MKNLLNCLWWLYISMDISTWSLLLIRAQIGCDIYNCFCNPTTREHLLTQRVSIKDLISPRFPKARNKAAFI